MSEEAAHSLLEVGVSAYSGVNHRQVVDEAGQVLLVWSYWIASHLLVLLWRRREEEDELHDLGQIRLAQRHVLGDLKQDLKISLALLSCLLLPVLTARCLRSTGLVLC